MQVHIIMLIVSIFCCNEHLFTIAKIGSFLVISKFKAKTESPVHEEQDGASSMPVHYCTHKYKYMHMHTLTHACMHICTQSHTHKHAYTHAHTRAHTHTHTHTHTLPFSTIIIISGIILCDYFSKSLEYFLQHIL